MATDKSVYIRVGVRDGDKAVEALRRIGVDGERAMGRIGDASRPAAAGLRAVNELALAGQGALAGYASGLGPVGAALGGVSLAAGAAAATVALATAGLIAGVRDFAQAEQRVLRMEAVLKATGQASGQTIADLEALSERLERNTLLTGETVNEASAIMLTFKKVTGDTFTTAIELAADMSTAFGVGMTGAATQLGKALEDPIQGVSALARVGVTFSTVQKEVIRDLVETGRVAEAQQVILEALAGQVGGSAGREGGGVSGAFHKAKTAVGDFLETIADKTGTAEEWRKDLEGIADAIWRVNGAMGGGDQNKFLGDQIKEGEARIAVLAARANQLIDNGAMGAQQRQAVQALQEEETRVASLRAALDELTAARLRLEEQGAPERAAAAEAAAAEATDARRITLEKFAAVQSRAIELARMESEERERLAAADKAEADLKKELSAINQAATEEDIKAARARALAEVSARQAVQAATKAQQERQRELEKSIQAEERATEKRVEAAAAIDRQIDGLVDEQYQLTLGERARAIHVELLRAEETARRAGIDLTEEQTARIREETGALYDGNAARETAREANRELEREREEASRQIERALENSADRIVDFSADAFETILSGGQNTWAEIANTAVGLMRRAFAQIASEAIIRPLIEPVISGVMGGVLGGGGGGAGGGGIAGAGVSLGDIFGISNLFGGGSSAGLYGTLASIAPSTFGGAAGTIGIAAGADPLLMAAEPALFGPAAAGGWGSAAGFLSDGLKASPWGLIGGVGARLLGLGGDGWGGTIGGMAGSIAGGGIGASLGTIFGLPGGPVGAALGAFLGTALGGLFGGGKPSDKTASFQGMLSGDLLPTEDGADAATAGARDRLQAIVQAAIGSISTATGGQLPGDIYLDVATGARDGNRYWAYRTDEDLYGLPASERPDAFASGSFEDPEKLVGGILATIVDTMEGVPEALQEKLRQVDFSDLERGLGDVDLITRFEKLFEAPETTAPFELSIRALTEAFEDARERATRLEMDVASVGDQFQQAMRRLYVGEEAIGPFATALKILEEGIAATAEEAERLGVTLSGQVVEAMADARQALTDDLMGGLNAAINDGIGKGYLNAAPALLENYRANASELEALGLSTSKAAQLLGVQLSNLFAGLTPSQVAEVRASLTALGADLDALTITSIQNAAELAVLQSDVDRSRTAYLQGLLAERAELDEQRRVWLGLADAMRNARNALAINTDLSPEGPDEIYGEARRQFLELLDKATAGDTAAAAQLAQLGPQFLEISRAFNSDQAAYRADYQMVADALAATELLAQREADRATALLSVNERQLASLDVLVTEAQTIAELLAEYQAAVLALANGRASTGTAGRVTQVPGSPGGSAADDAIIEGRGITYAQRDAFLQSEGVTAAGGGLVMDRIESDAGFAERYREYIRGLGQTPNFLGGGWHQGGIARVHNEELIYTGPAAHVWNAAQTRELLGGGGLGGGGGGMDASAVVAAVQRGSAATVDAVAALADMIAALAGQVARLVETETDLSREVQLLARRPAVVVS